MKYYAVPEDVLFLIKDIIDSYSSHRRECEVDDCEFCTCGYWEKHKEYIKKCPTFKEVTTLLSDKTHNEQV